jgi:tRNA (cmo5U34)-methyltransferase
MTDFEKTNWSKPEFTQQYRDNADNYIVERKRMFGILRSFYEHFLKDRGKNNVLDLGCGDGILTYELLNTDDSISATLVDGSDDMLNKAKERLAGFKNINFIRSSFQEILEKDTIRQKFDFVISSMAVHHLTMSEKKALFGNIYSHLNEGGCFVNIDVILAPAESLEEWYLRLWQGWMDEKKASTEGEGLSDIITRYKQLEENRPDVLEDQLNALKELGFRDVDCFYKYGIFTIYGGKK